MSSYRRGRARRVGRKSAGFIRPQTIAIASALVLGTGVATLVAAPQRAATVAQAPGAEGVSSGPIAITSDNQFVWSVNPDANSVAAVRVTGDANQVVRRLNTDAEPQGVAISPDNQTIAVANAVGTAQGGTVTIIRAPGGNAARATVLGRIIVGTEPHSVLFTPDGSKLYCANMSSNDITVIRTSDFRVIGTIPNVGENPRGLTIANRKLYVTQWIAQIRSNDPRPADQREGRDDSREGRVTVINTATDTVVRTIVLNPMDPARVGFKSNGSTLDKVPPRNDAAGNQIFDTDTGCFPNELQCIAVKGNFAFVPAIGSSPNGPFRFNVNCQSMLSVINLANDTEDRAKTFNMNNGLGAENPATRLFLSNPTAIAFSKVGNEGYVCAAGIDQVIKVNLAANGAPTVNAPTPVRISTTTSPNGDFTTLGKNPEGIVLNSTGTRAYVACTISRDVAVLDLQANKLLKNVPTANLPGRNSREGRILRGKQLFFTAIGPAGTDPAFPDSAPPGGVMSDRGWGGCRSCHFQGLTDNVTWMFADGPRQTIPLDGTFDHLSLNSHKILNWSAVRDEVQDFDLNTRAVFGGQGLINNADGTQNKDVFGLVKADNSLALPNRGRNADLDALELYQAVGIRSRIAPNINRQVFQAGVAIFLAAGCTDCHVGRQWTNAIRDFTPPPTKDFQDGKIVDLQLTRFLKNVGTFDPTKANELKANANVNNAVPGSRGKDGLLTPSLLSVFSSAPYLHDGSAATLEQVLDNPVHRRAGANNPAVDILNDAQQRAVLVQFLKSIDLAAGFFQPAAR
jgi:YVTN family beta-propeller protein